MTTSKKILQTHFPFLLKMRLRGESIGNELYGQITRISKKYGKPPRDFSAKVEILPNPEDRDGHFLVSEVIYLKGKLK